MTSNRRQAVKRPLLIAALCAATGAATLAAPTVKKWLFTDKNEMEQTVRQYADNPRAAYYIIVRAHKRDLAAQAAVAYYDLMKKKASDPYLKSAFAFSHFLATGLYSREFANEKSTKLVQQLRQQQGEASFYRDEALESKPDSPVILLETAQFLAAQGLNRDKEKAVDLLRRAVKQDPKWADTHYWLGYTLSSLWTPNRAHRIQSAKEALPHLDEAERLEPKMRPECLISRVYAYQMLDDKPKQLQYMEAYLKVRPEAAKKKWLANWRKSLRDDLAKQKKPGA